MGSGTFVDGVLRWFHNHHHNNRRSNEDGGGTVESDSKSSSLSSASSSDTSSTSIIQQQQQQKDFDISLLKHIRVPKRIGLHPPSPSKPIDPHHNKKLEAEFFTEYGEASRYQVQEVIGKGSYGVVGSAIDTHTGEKVAIKKINDVFEHVSDATRILREIKLLRLLKHPDIVEIKHIMLPPSRREFKDIYVVFELMECDLHQVTKANDDLTPQHCQFFLYQLLRGLKYIHSANVFHRDLKPKNILANADCKLKICDFGLARVSFNDAPSAIFWTDYVATRWYRAPELCGSFFSKYTPGIDIWGIGCIFAEMLSGRPLFPGKNVVNQLDLMTNFLGTPSSDSLARIRKEKARRYLSNMRKKPAVPFVHRFPNADPLALRLLERLLSFDPKDRPSAEEVSESLGAITSGSQLLEPDGLFHNHIPNPEDKASMKAITQAVRNNKADLEIIFDTDVDSLVWVSGYIIWRNRNSYIFGTQKKSYGQFFYAVYGDVNELLTGCFWCCFGVFFLLAILVLIKD